MAHRFFFVALFLSTLAVSLQKDITQNTDYDYDDDHFDDSEAIGNSEEIQKNRDIESVPETSSKGEQKIGTNVLKIGSDREVTTEKQFAKYEVTELVMDIPDPGTRRVPVVRNFTLTRPLNFAAIPNSKTDKKEENINDDGDEIINSILVPNIPRISNNDQGKNIKGVNFKSDVNKDENDFFSHLSSKDSFEEIFDKEFGDDDDDFLEDEEEPKSNGFKDHFHNIRKSIVNEFQSVVNKHKDGIHDSLRKIVNGPISFFSKLHRKSSELAHKLHKAVSSPKYHDHDDDSGFEGVDHDHGGD